MHEDTGYTQDIMFLACSGASKEGPLSNRAAVELTKEGCGRMFSLAGIAAGMSGFVQSAKDVERMVVIDGCETACGRTIIENAGIPLKEHVVVARLDIEKSNAPSLKPEDISTVKHAVRLALNFPVKVVFNSPKPLSPAEEALSKMLGGKCC